MLGAQWVCISRTDRQAASAPRKQPKPSLEQHLSHLLATQTLHLALLVHVAMCAFSDPIMHGVAFGEETEDHLMSVHAPLATLPTRTLPSGLSPVLYYPEFSLSLKREIFLFSMFFL
jgi:hypothetical protein